MGVEARNPFRDEDNKHLKQVSHASQGGFSVRLERKQSQRSPSHPKRLRYGQSIASEGEGGSSDTMEQVRMHNYHDFSYSGTIYLGSPESQAMEVVYDTGSDWLTVEGANCHLCQGNLYDHTQSDDFAFLESVQSTELNYGSASLKGLRASDKVCLSQGPATMSGQSEVTEQ